jgi:transcriptional regulator with XRE-family HTH domain
MGSHPAPDTAVDQKGEALRLLAQDIRALRKAHGLTLSGLAERLGRSVGWLSQVERGISLPSLADLRALAQQFKVPVSLFLSAGFADDGGDGLIVRHDRRRLLGARDEGVVEQLLSPGLGGGFAMVRAEFAPGAGVAEPRKGAREEAGYLLAGNLEVEIGDAWHSLAAGDSFQFRNQSVRWRNSGAGPAVVIRVVSPPVY